MAIRFWLFLVLFGNASQKNWGQSLTALRSFQAPAAQQAVAVDDSFFYAIGNRVIEKYEKENGNLVRRWEDRTGVFKHLNSGVVIDGKLYCAHSNFPNIPMASSIEIFDTQTLQPVESHSFGIDIGSATWIDWYKGHWYVAFAHYNRFKDQIGKDNRWTQIVRFSPDWHRQAAWILPDELIDRFGSMSNSGGFIMQEGKIYLTGHDFKEIYEMEFPANGYALIWKRTLPAPFEGQGIAADPGDAEIIYGISRSQKTVIEARINKE